MEHRVQQLESGLRAECGSNRGEGPVIDRPFANKVRCCEYTDCLNDILASQFTKRGKVWGLALTARRHQSRAECK